MSEFDHNQFGPADLYRQNILEHSRSPRNKRKITNASVSQHNSNMSCGDDVEIFIRIENQHLMDISFEGSGCAISQAATSMLTEKVRGLTVDEVLSYSQEDLFELLGVRVGPSRIKCASLGLETLKKALKKL